MSDPRMGFGGSPDQSAPTGIPADGQSPVYPSYAPAPQYPGTAQPAPGYPQPAPQYQPYGPPQQQYPAYAAYGQPGFPTQGPYAQPPYGQSGVPPRGSGPSNRILWAIIALLVVALAVTGVVAYRMTHPSERPSQTTTSAPLTDSPEPVPTPTKAPSTTTTTVSPTTTSAPPPTTTTTTPTATTGPPTSQPPIGTYARERNELTAPELLVYGGLAKGDCLVDRPDDLSAGVTTVDCAQPHTDQVMGFVDLSEGMPDVSDAISFEMAVARRCNSVKATLPIPADFDKGVAANYPDPPEWEDGVRAALCWVPVFHTTWTGSAIDGTAQKV